MSDADLIRSARFRQEREGDWRRLADLVDKAEGQGLHRMSFQEARDLAEWYESEVAFYSYRHIVRPGITGWAQVNQGHVTDLDAIQSKLRLDFYYVKNLSLWLDILIALKTIRVILGGIGAR